jgi:uncharacterized membrane protein
MLRSGDMGVNLPLFLHLIGYALWLGAGAGVTVLAVELRRRRDWKEREVLSTLLLRMGYLVLLPAMLLTLGGGLWLFLATRQDWPPPRWLYLKILLAIAPFCAGVGGWIYRVKIRRVVESAITVPSASLEDQFEGLTRGYLLTGVLFLLTIGFVLALAVVRPNW